MVRPIRARRAVQHPPVPVKECHVVRWCIPGFQIDRNRPFLARRAFRPSSCRPAVNGLSTFTSS
jgi:hypothetical protein